MFLERDGEAVRQFFRAGHHEPQAAEIVRRTAAQVELQERRRGQQERDLMPAHERADGFRVERICVIHHARAQHGGQAQRAGEAERMEKRQDAQHAIARRQAEHLLHLLDVGTDVVMREHHALGFARAAAGEDHGGEIV